MMKKNIQGNIEQGELGEILEKEGKFGKKVGMDRKKTRKSANYWNRKKNEIWKKNENRENRREGGKL